MSVTRRHSAKAVKNNQGSDGQVGSLVTSTRGNKGLVHSKETKAWCAGQSGDGDD